MTTEEINKLTHRIIGCAMEVHNQMGNGFRGSSLSKSFKY